MIEVSHIYKSFGTFRAVNDVSFSIPTGQIVGLLGPNGAGKTTTMRMITGFLEPSAGTILIDGQNIQDNPVEVKKKIGYMPESAPLYGEMIVKDYLEYIAAMQGQDPSVKVPELCRECGLKEVMSKNISELSRGNRQRVALAHALMNDPEILILDEPTSGLDPNQVEDVREIIREIGKTKTVIISTHILSEVETLCSNIIIISDGQVVANSPTEELKAQFGHALTVKVTVDSNSVDAAKTALESNSDVDSIAVSEKKDGKNNLCVLSICIKGNKEIRPQIIESLVKAKCGVYEMSLHKNSLEDIFHLLTAEKSEEK
ncbi:MAG: ABC transporter ATP-binding protein [Treponema sp.]|nr:ABC transporter ATP-binding protein [Spirochaetia bacterium]MDY3131466.1 ABC transporter ATP-binding protein [Treponema sp.]